MLIFLENSNAKGNLNRYTKELELKVNAIKLLMATSFQKFFF
jgi:hypothetical protein